MPANPIGVALRNRRAGQHTLVWARPDLKAPENFTLTSPAFGHGAPIPEKHRGRMFGANISPALDWTRPPAGAVELAHGRGGLGRRGWAGPMPPRSHGPHAYVFQLFALDQATGLAAGRALREVVAAMAGHVIGRARLDGTYEIR